MSNIKIILALILLQSSTLKVFIRQYNSILITKFKIIQKLVNFFKNYTNIIFKF